jgi:DNA-binding transcriptional MerR regulator
MWTMDELVERVREALAAEYSGAPNGRVRDVPDRRAIRWYTTIGLVDKPLGMRGRTALYGPRHLQQLVAIKRLQAAGRSLSQIQVEFSWLTAKGLSEVSRVPESLIDSDGEAQPDEVTEPRERFWARSAAQAPTQSSWHTGQPAPGASGPPHEPVLAGPPGRTLAARPLSAVALDGGVVLVIPQPVTDRDLDDIAVAAEPLLALLAARGLTDGSSS